VEKMKRVILKKNLKEMSIKIWEALAHPDRWEIMLQLYQSGKPLSFSELKNSLRKEYFSSSFSYHLRILEKTGLIINERRLDIQTGKARSSFYSLSLKGKKVIDALLDLLAR
jgi:DNA-binding MarR family transcriptional regulator